MISEKTIGRLSLYRRQLNQLLEAGASHIYSHELARLVGGTAAQVRRDLMVTGYTGSPTKGYDIAGLVGSIRQFLDSPGGENVVLVGVGNLGRALLAYFIGRRRGLAVVAAFDADPGKTGRVIHGCRCHPMEDLEQVVADRDVRVAMLAVPSSAAQAVADHLFGVGIGGLLNFAPTPLRAPAHAFVENIDMTMALEKVVYFARQKQQERED